MDNVITLLKRVDEYITLANCEESTASLRIFNDGKRLKTLRARQRMWPETIDAANEKLDQLFRDLAAADSAA